MNLNDNPKRLQQEEQKVLDILIAKMDKVIQRLDRKMKRYVEEAKNVDVITNPDLYLAQILAEQGKKDTAENRKQVLQSRDELYHTRLLLQYEDSSSKGIEEIKVGLHECNYGSERFIASWKMPICFHYIVNTSTEYPNVVKGKHGEKYYTNYKLLVKNQVELRFSHVKKALNMYPGICDDKLLKMIKGTGFFSDSYLDEMIENFNFDDYNPDSVAEIIADEFLQELLERRVTPEFKNIVFSIQKKQGELIRAPYDENMIVQGCAGSGKSMIMLHRLPIILYDNPNSLKRTNLYIITPSRMYIQLAQNMRYQLEISDINMGTIEQYYDFCIEKYSNHNATEYGNIDYDIKIGKTQEKYIFSEKCISDINEYFEQICKGTGVSLDDAYTIFQLEKDSIRKNDTYEKRISNKLLELQKILNANSRVILQYFYGIQNVLNALHTLQFILKNQKNKIVSEIDKQISKRRKEILENKKKLEDAVSKENMDDIKKYQEINLIKSNEINELKKEKINIQKDYEYFYSLKKLEEYIGVIVKPFEILKREFNQNDIKDIYDLIDKRNQWKLFEQFFVILSKSSKIKDKYRKYVDPIAKNISIIGQSIGILRSITVEYLDYKYYDKIQKERIFLTKANSVAIKNAYKLIMKKVMIETKEVRAIKYSPYIYLQAIYLYQGKPSIVPSTLLAIDEAQGIASEEIRLLKNINGSEVIFNIYGDINQHIEGNKGINSWDEYKNIIDFNLYEIQENYRNASQITEYCNKEFNMNMIAINTPGKGVHEIKNFFSEMLTLLTDDIPIGLSAILVSNKSEARYLLEKFSLYEQKFNDMTDGAINIHRTKWNVITIDDAKGLEFRTVIVLSGRMSHNEKYIAFTRALDGLYVYSKKIDVTKYEEGIVIENSRVPKEQENSQTKYTEDVACNNYKDSKLKGFFESKGLEVIDNRDKSGKLWVIGEKSIIKEIVNEAITEFSISGKYASSNEIKNKNGWYTKAKK